MEKIPNLTNQSLLTKENINLSDEFSVTQSYNLLLNEYNLKKIIRRNIWKCHLDSLLEDYMNDIKQEKEEINFRKSGKILFSSSYLLKAKTKQIINDSLNTQDNIKEIEGINEESIENEYFDNDHEKNESINHLNAKSLTQRIKDNEICLESPKKMVYKAINLNDLALALTEVIKTKNNEKKIRKPKENIVDQISLLPKSFIENKREKRENLNIRIQNFYKTVVEAYNKEPLPFLFLLKRPNRQELVDILMYILYLCNRKKIKIWQKVPEENFENSGKSKNEKYKNLDNGSNIYISPVL